MYCTLLSDFPSILSCAHVKVLYLFNRNALLEGFEVRSAQVRDVEGVSKLVEGMPNGEDIIGAFKSALGEHSLICQDLSGFEHHNCPSHLTYHGKEFTR